LVIVLSVLLRLVIVLSVLLLLVIVLSILLRLVIGGFVKKSNGHKVALAFGGSLLNEDTADSLAGNSDYGTFARFSSGKSIDTLFWNKIQTGGWYTGCQGLFGNNI
jgi:hypothetical protein